MEFNNLIAQTEYKQAEIEKLLPYSTTQEREKKIFYFSHNVMIGYYWDGREISYR